MITTDNPVVALHFNRARAAAISARADAKLARLGAETATRRPGAHGGAETAARRGGNDWLTRGLSVEQIEKDTAFIRTLTNLWKRNRRARPYRGTGVTLPSGRRFVFRPGEGIRRP